MTIITNSENTSQSSQSNTNTEDTNSVHHPLYFHQNDHHRLVLIPKKFTGLENYNTWRRSMMITLNGGNKLKLINDALEARYACTCKCDCENGKATGEREHRKRLIQFLMGLDDSYTNNIRGQILLMQPLPLVSKAYNMLRHEEKQRDVPKSSPM
ncbi:cysteine-rich receptor-like protein kinase 8 [Tanacetum coccineum]